MKHLVYDAQTGEGTFVEVPDLEPMPLPDKPETPIEAKVEVMRERLTRVEQATTENGDTQQQLIEILAAGGVI